MSVKQSDIDTAVLIGKSATARLAYELAIEVKYGGNADCCMCKLKLLWSYTDALLCIKETNTEAENCLTDVKVKKLIGKIRAMCTVTFNSTNPNSRQFSDSFSDSFL